MNFVAMILCLSTLVITFIKASELHARTTCRQRTWLKLTVQKTGQTLSTPPKQLPGLGRCPLRTSLDLNLKGKL